MKMRKRRLTDLGNVWIRGEETPVDVGSISDVWVVALGGRYLQDLLDKTLCLLGFLEEELDHCREDLQLRLYMCQYSFHLRLQGD